MARVQDKVIIITGGARGMGAATTRLFVQEGAAVVIADMLADEGNALASELGGKAAFIRHDVTSEDSWRALVADVLRRHGRIDALVNNAGVCAMEAITEVSSAEFDRIFSVNLKGPIFGMKHVGGAMQSAGRGAIVNISSVDGLRGANSLSVYSASKWALRGVTKSAALEFGPYGVRVNSVHPGGIDTAMGNPESQQGEERNWAYGRVPLQRIGEPNEVAAASLFLCSDEASYITGAELAVDGGWAAGYYHSYLPTAPASIRGNS
jgi:3alpha(or 20beta)-hydroxysteroid dehydrogenase